MAIKLAQAFVEIRAIGTQMQGDIAAIRKAAESQLGILSQRLTGLNAVATGTGRVFGVVNDSFLRMRGSVAGLVAGLGGMATAFLAVRAAAQEVLSFNKNITSSLAVQTGITEAQRKEMERAAVVWSTKTGVAASDLAGSLLFLAQAGFTAQEQIQLLGTVSKFAVAGMMDVKEAAEVLTDVQAALGLKVTDMSDKMQQAAINQRNLVYLGDLLTKANALAQGSIEDFAEALRNKGAGAIRAFGLSIEDGVALLTAFAERGIKGQEAGTRLDIVLRSLTRNNIRSAEAFKKHKVSIFDANGQMRQSFEIMGDLQRALSHLNDESRQKALAELFRDIKSIPTLALLLGSSVQLRRFGDELRDSAGTMDRVFMKQMESFVNQLKVAFRQVGALVLAIGTPLVGALTRVASVFGVVSGAIGTSEKAFGEAARGILTFLIGVRAASSLLPMLSRLGAAIVVFAARATDAVGLLGPLSRAIGGFVSDTLGAIPVLGLFFRALGGVVSVLGTIAGFPLGLAISSRIGKVGEIVKSMFDTSEVKNALAKALPQFEIFMDGVAKIAMKVGESLIRGMLGVANAFFKELGFALFDKEIGTGLANLIKTLGTAAERLGAIMSALANEWESVWDFISGSLDIAISRVMATLYHWAAELQLVAAQVLNAFSKIPGEAGREWEKMRNKILAPAPGGSFDDALKNATQTIRDRKAADGTYYPGTLVEGGRVLESQFPGDSSIVWTVNRLMEALAGEIAGRGRKVGGLANIGREIRDRLAGLRVGAKMVPRDVVSPRIDATPKGTGSIRGEHGKKIDTFTQFAELSRQLQEAIAGDELKGAIDRVAKAAEYGNSLQEEANANLRQIAGDAGHQDGPPKAAPGVQMVPQRPPRPNKILTGPRLPERTPSRPPKAVQKPLVAPPPDQEPGFIERLFPFK